MVAHINTVAFQGIETRAIDVQVQMSNGLPAFSIVGLPDKAVTEARERVRSALTALGLSLPPKRITVNLSPADLQKEGSHFDLPIALGLLVAMEVMPAEDLQGFVVLGELGLDGAIAPVAGVLPAAIDAHARDCGLICPEGNGGEAAWAGAAPILAAPSLLSLINHFKGSQLLSTPKPGESKPADSALDLADVKGQEAAKRALEIAAAGSHNLLMNGPPGAGKSMLAARMPGILPPMTAREALEVSMIRSVAGLLKDGQLDRTRPFRDPHHSSSMPALVGGGNRARPGEISLAHNGVLFLDELPEYARGALESLRQPLETGYAVVARANAHVTYPARFQLIAAMNPCRCGHIDDPEVACRKAPRCADDYQARISGPLFDRIDLHVTVSAVKPHELTGMNAAESSAEMAARVMAARELQGARYARLPENKRIRTNAEADGRLLSEVAEPDAEGQKILTLAVDRLKLSGRGYHRILRVARTLADLDGSETVRKPHIAEAVAYRRTVAMRG